MNEIFNHIPLRSYAFKLLSTECVKRFAYNTARGEKNSFKLIWVASAKTEIFTSTDGKTVRSSTWDIASSWEKLKVL